MIIYKGIFVLMYFHNVIAKFQNGSFDETNHFEGDDLYGEPNERNCKKCGIAIHAYTIKGRIINGRPVVPIHKYPWIVNYITDGKDKKVCGGALISATFIVTAAHCLFRYELRNDPLCSASRVHKSCFISPKQFHLTTASNVPLSVEQIIGHPQYNFRWESHDIALIQLTKPVPCSERTLPICLPRGNLVRVGQELIIAGFGAINSDGISGPLVLREGSARVVNASQCREHDQPTDTHLANICTVPTKSVQLPCYGDSGSAMFGQHGKKFYALGITSTAADIRCQPPDTFTKVSFYIDWIKLYVEDLPLV